MEDEEHGRTNKDEDNINKHEMFIGNEIETRMKGIADERKYMDETSVRTRSWHSLIHTVTTRSPAEEGKPAHLEHGGKENYTESTDRPVPGKNLVRSDMRLEIARARWRQKGTVTLATLVARFGTR